MNAVREMSVRDGASINQFINVAVAEKLSVLMTEEFFNARARRADPEKFYAVLDKFGTEPPREGDELPEGFDQTDLYKRLKGARK
jgi:hypothetical protein